MRFVAQVSHEGSKLPAKQSCLRSGGSGSIRAVADTILEFAV